MKIFFITFTVILCFLAWHEYEQAHYNLLHPKIEAISGASIKH